MLAVHINEDQGNSRDDEHTSRCQQCVAWLAYQDLPDGTHACGDALEIFSDEELPNPSYHIGPPSGLLKTLGLAKC